MCIRKERLIAMECRICDKPIDVKKTNDFSYDYAGDILCNTCMEQETERG